MERWGLKCKKNEQHTKITKAAAKKNGAGQHTKIPKTEAKKMGEIRKRNERKTKL